MNNILSLITQYLLKGGFLTLITNYFGNIRNFVKSALWQSVIQVIVLAVALFLIDWILPRFFPQPATPQLLGLGQGQGQNALDTVQNLVNMFAQKRQEAPQVTL